MLVKIYKLSWYRVILLIVLIIDMVYICRFYIKNFEKLKMKKYLFSLIV